MVDPAIHPGAGKEKFSKIDVHSHFVPDKYRQDCIDRGHSRPDGTLGVPTWSEQAHLEMMDSLDISKAYLSITSPGTHLVDGDDSLARRITRECNQAAAQFKRRCPDRIGFFASTPLPDVEGTLEEIERAYSTDPVHGLNADGIALKTNHHGTYLGDVAFEPVMQRLNEHDAIVFIHPTTPCAVLDFPSSSSPGTPNGSVLHDHHKAGRAVPALPLPRYPAPMLEFFFETARTATNLLLSGTVTRYPRIRYILSHCGGALPPMLRRICGASPIVLGPTAPPLTPESLKTQLNSQFYFDTAGWSFPEQIQGLLCGGIGVERILYGTDFPWTPLKVVTQLAGEYDHFIPTVFREEWEREAVSRGNARKLFLCEESGGEEQKEVAGTR